MKHMKTAAFIAAVALSAAMPARAEADTIFGRWLVESGKAVIELFSCGQEACGRLVWLKNPFDSVGDIKRDSLNPDPLARSRPLCGLTLVSGLVRKTDGEWESGEIYSTRDGKSYSLEVKTIGPTELAVRGYVGLSLFGKTQTWRRDGMLRNSCTTMLRAPGADR